MRIGKFRGSFLPILHKVVSLTTGPILELGVGYCSSPYLHWMCNPTRRPIVSYENNPSYYDFAKQWEDTFHQVLCVTEWDGIDLSGPWSVAFVDHEPPHRRAVETSKLTHAEFVVIHDTENSQNRKYRISTVIRLYKYHWKWTGAVPHTSVLSNLHDVGAMFEHFPN